MKFELRTESEKYTKSLGYIFRTIFNTSLVIIFCDVAFKIGIISRHYQIDYSCNELDNVL